MAEESNLKKMFEESKSTLDFLNQVISMTAGEVDDLRNLSVDDEAQSRVIAKRINSLRFVSDLVELKKKVESSKFNVNTEVSEADAKAILTFSLNKLKLTLMDFNMTKDEVKEVYRILVGRLNDWDELKDFIANYKTAN